MVAGRFGRVEPRHATREFVLGLLSPVERKNCWWLAEQAGHGDPQARQRLLRTAAWDADAVRDDVRGFVADRLGDAAGVLICDETGFVKKGTGSVGCSASTAAPPGGSRTPRSACSRPTPPPTARHQRHPALAQLAPPPPRPRSPQPLPAQTSHRARRIMTWCCRTRAAGSVRVTVHDRRAPASACRPGRLAHAGGNRVLCALARCPALLVSAEGGARACWVWTVRGGQVVANHNYHDTDAWRAALSTNQ
jgi:DDE superfamily endonuclease